MQENSQGTFFLMKEILSLYYKILVIKLYDAEIRIDKWIHIKEKNKIVGYTIYLLCIIYKGGI